MSRYTADSRDRVRDAVDMLVLVSEKIELRRAGANEYVGLCPFHDERTPSFGVNPLDKVYHCFGCQASGDLFTFVMEAEGLDFTGALEALADRFGVELETEAEDPRAATKRERRERLHGLLGRAAAYYERYLWEASEAEPAREYLLRRGFQRETLSAFRVGYAPSAWDRMLRASRSAGFTEEELLVAGLAQRSKAQPGRVYDRFRERIMFPTADERGRVIGFGARAMRDNQRPKYLNSAEGELYQKRRVLYGIDLALRSGATRSGRMILVEGYTDVLALHEAGIANAVGIMGTSLTEEQIAALARRVQILVLCLDADSAGEAAMLRAAEVAPRHNVELRVVPLPAGADPAELMSEGAEALRARVETSVPFAAFHVERILEQADVRSAEGRDRALAELAPVLRPVPASVLREDLVRRVAGRLELSDASLSALLSTRTAGAVATQPRVEGTPSAPATVADEGLRAERTFLAMCIALPEPGRAALAAVEPDELLMSDQMRRAARHIAARTDSPLADLPHDEDGLARTVADLVARAGRTPDVSEARLEHARYVLERARLERAIRRARMGGGGDVSALAREREAVLESIRRVVGELA